MKFITGKYKGEFYIILETDMYNGNERTAQYLNIPYGDFIEILEKHGAHKMARVDGYLFFKTKYQLNKAIEELEPYLIMANLTEE